MPANTLFPGVALVTGAGGKGIGATIAAGFAAAGCSRIAITDVNATTLAQTREKLVASHPDLAILAREGDISQTDFIESFVADVVATLGRLDYLVNCAGVLGEAKRSTDLSPERFDWVNNVNYRGCWLASRAALMQMVKQDPLESHDPSRPSQRGAIVNVASQLGKVGRPDSPAYCASKAAVIALTRSDAIDYSRDGIRVNCVCPGIIESPMTTSSQETQEALSPLVNATPMKRMGKAREIADAVLFLCSTHASFIQGHALGVDGGYILV
ncbi:hypothetical protein BJY01DRAFT_235536 [Aspergillus pseudoustus]|uniref:Oxidoreductase n=1 Tax=Aspergillus pseudoustus TaxID=1810923 RepID=A0ABR4JUH3_9EURO